jgi:peptide/nickel transport system substrate-binding protein
LRAPAKAEYVKNSLYAKLVSVETIRVLAGVINRDAPELPLGDKRARQALNLAVNREAVIEALYGFAHPLAGLTPPSALKSLHKVKPYSHDPQKALKLWRQAGRGTRNVLRIASASKWEKVTRIVGTQIQQALALPCEISIYNAEEMRRIQRRLAEKKLPQEWDILLIEQGAQAADSPPLEIHRAFAGQTGEFRAGSIVPEFERIYEKLTRQTSVAKQGKFAYKLDRFVFEEALALFLCAPEVLYAVNRHVNFVPYRTSFELAESNEASPQTDEMYVVDS